MTIDVQRKIGRGQAIRRICIVLELSGAVRTSSKRRGRTNACAKLSMADSMGRIGMEKLQRYGADARNRLFHRRKHSKWLTDGFCEFQRGTRAPPTPYPHYLDASQIPPITWVIALECPILHEHCTSPRSPDPSSISSRGTKSRLPG